MKKLKMKNEKNEREGGKGMGGSMGAMGEVPTQQIPPKPPQLSPTPPNDKKKWDWRPLFMIDVGQKARWASATLSWVSPIHWPIIGLPPHTSSPIQWKSKDKMYERNKDFQKRWLGLNESPGAWVERCWLLTGAKSWGDPPSLPPGRPLASSWNPRPAVATRRSQRTPVHSSMLHQEEWTRAPGWVYTSTGQNAWTRVYTSADHRPLLKPTSGRLTQRGSQLWSTQ